MAESSRRARRQHGIEHEVALNAGEAALNRYAADSDEIGMEPTEAGDGADYGYDHEPAHAMGDEPALRGSGLDRRNVPGFAEFYLDRRQSTRVSRRWLAVITASLIAGPFAVLGAMFAGSGQTWFGLVAIGAIGPLVEEMLKVSGVLYLAERHPWVVPSWWVIPIGAAVSGFMFAWIENLWYLNVLIGDPSPLIITWRWTVCVALHVGCSFIAGVGVGRMWRDTDRHRKAPNLATASPYLISAVIVHGAYNVLAVILEMGSELR